MKKTIIAVVIAGTMVASSTFAIPFSGDISISANPGYSGGNGGEYTITALAPTVFGDFQSFCLEYTETVHWPPLTYTLSKVAVAGGSAPGMYGPDGNAIIGDPVSIGTAWLYKQFIAGTLAGYDYAVGPGREASARNLQLAIWFLENETLYTTQEAQDFIALADAAFATDITLGDFGAQGVYAMNLTDASGLRSQDMLALPDGGATLSLLGLGLLGLGMASRRLRRA